MAQLTFKSTGEVLKDDAAISAVLSELGIFFERWPLPDSVLTLVNKDILDAEDKQGLLDGYQEMLDRFKAEGYPAADVVALNPHIPGLDEMLAKFDKEHFHTDDEIRFIAAGEGIFGFNPDWDKGEFDLLVEAGDYINVPKDTWHWFTLTPSRRIVAIRFFQDTSGWTPHYKNTEAGISN